MDHRKYLMKLNNHKTTAPYPCKVDGRLDRLPWLCQAY